MGGGVFTRTKSWAGTNLETWNGAFLSGQRAGVARHDEALSNSQMKRGRRSEGEFAESASVNLLELAEGREAGRVDLKDGAMTGSGDPGLGKFGLKI